MKAVRVLLPALLLASCGEGGGVDDRGAYGRRRGGLPAPSFPSFRFHAGEVDIVSIDAAGNVRVGTARGAIDGRAPARVDLGAVAFGLQRGLGAGSGTGSGAGLGWFSAPAFRVPVDTVPFSPDGAFACAIGGDLRLLAAAIEDGRAADLEPPVLTAGGAAEGRVDGCAARRAIRCYLAIWDLPPAGGPSLAALRDAVAGRGAEARAAYAFALAQAAQEAAACAAGAGASSLRTRAREPAQGATFAFTDAALVFSPSPLLSLSIYDGEREDYDDALVRSLPVAFVAVPDDCAAEGGACVVSPWPASKCRKCDKLRKGRTYTAFLVERAGQLHRDVKRVVFRR